MSAFEWFFNLIFTESFFSFVFQKPNYILNSEEAGEELPKRLFYIRTKSKWEMPTMEL